MFRVVAHLSIILMGLLYLSPSIAGAQTSEEETEKTPSEQTSSIDEAADDAPEGGTEDEIVVVGEYLYNDVVNALRTPTPILDVPQSLSITTADQIAQQAFRSLGEIVDYTPGVNTSQGEGHRDAIVFRGVRSTADFFIDGMRDDVQYYRPLYNLEQVEILRGPNAILFGRGGGGGILNRVTKKGLIGESFSSYQVEFDSYGEFSAQVDGNYREGDQRAFRINAFYESLANDRDFYDGDRIGINPTARLRLSLDTILDLSYEYVDHERFVDRGIPTGGDGRPVEAFDEIVFADSELNTTEIKAHLVRARLEHHFTDSLKGNFNAFYGDYDKMYQNFYANDYDEVANIVELDGYVDTTDRQNAILSADLVGEFETGGLAHTLIGGLEYIDTSSDQDRFNAYFDTSADDVAAGIPGARTDRANFSVERPIDLRNGVGIVADGRTTTNSFDTDLNDDTRVGINVFSAYLQDELRLSEMLHLILGARFDSFDIDVFNVPANETRTRQDEEISPRLGVVFKPQPNISFYGSYTESFLPRSGEQFANINGDTNRLDPNTFSNLEFGLKWDLNPRLALTAAIFELEQESPVVSDLDPSRFDILRTTTEGLEIQVRGLLLDNWFVSAGYSFLDGEQADGQLRPRELPEHMASIWNHVQATELFGLGAGLTYQDESFINNSNTAVLPSYTRVDAAAYYDVSETLRLQLNIENLTDELYFPNAHSTHQATVGASRSARLMVRGRF